MSFPRPEHFNAPVTERLSQAARAALREGPVELAVVTVTERAGVAVHADEVDVVTIDELRGFEERLQARTGVDEVGAYEIERGMMESE